MEGDWSALLSNRRWAVGFKSRALGLRSLLLVESLPWPETDVLPASPVLQSGFRLVSAPLRAGSMAHKQIYYSDKYFDEHYEYR